MKILITGATGLIGSKITQLALKKGHTIHYLTTTREKIRTEENLRGFYWNPSRGEIDMQAFEGADALINLAGVTIAKRWTDSYKKKIIHSRISSLQLLRDALEKQPHPTLTAIATASAIGIYPHSYTEYYEETATGADNSFLGEVVGAWEHAADTLKRPGISLAKIRTGMVLAEEGGALPPMVRAVKYYVGAPFGNGRQWQSWIHITDIAGMYLFIIENQLDGVYNAVAPDAVTNARLIKEIASVLKKRLFLPAIPKGILKLILGEMAYVLYNSQRVSSKKITEKGFTFQFKTIHAALKDLL